jgi:hypothetical protein
VIKAWKCVNWIVLGYRYIVYRVRISLGLRQLNWLFLRLMGLHSCHQKELRELTFVTCVTKDARFWVVAICDPWGHSLTLGCLKLLDPSGQENFQHSLQTFSRLVLIWQRFIVSNDNLSSWSSLSALRRFSTRLTGRKIQRWTAALSVLQVTLFQLKISCSFRARRRSTKSFS